jgi:hypothetical protein
MRKMTGKASELAALLARLPMDLDFFQMLEADFVSQGQLCDARADWVYRLLLKLPLCVPQDALRQLLNAQRSWYIEQLMEVHKLAAVAAAERVDATLESLFAGWRDPSLRRMNAAGQVVEEFGAPLRAMVAYLFGEVAKNFYLIHHTDEWIACVTRSQCGDRCFQLDPDRLPSPRELRGELEWEKPFAGPELMEHWLKRFGAVPFDYNRGLDDESLSSSAVPLHRMEGTNFFRGLALIDVAEAMLKRAFGQDAIAVRVNAAGQGDYFQVHIDTTRADITDVKQFLGEAFYRRFGLSPSQDFVEPYPGGGAAGVRLSRFDKLPGLIHELKQLAGGATAASERS